MPKPNKKKKSPGVSVGLSIDLDALFETAEALKEKPDLHPELKAAAIKGAVNKALKIEGPESAKE